LPLVRRDNCGRLARALWPIRLCVVLRLHSAARQSLWPWFHGLDAAFQTEMVTIPATLELV
jgi:hypothetical protein